MSTVTPPAIPGQTIPVTALLALPDNKHPVESPLWYLHDLERELAVRQSLIGLHEDYYEGRHKLNFLTSTYREAFAQMLAGVCDNWIPLIIRAWVERLKPQGFTIGDAAEGDKAAWDIWQQNGLDSDIPLAFTESGKHGESYLLTWPDEQPKGIFGRFFSRRASEAVPRITLEHPSQVIVRRDAADRRRRKAALKKWREDDGTLMANLWLPGEIRRYRRTEGTDWVPRELDGVNAVDSYSRHPFIPMVPLVNDPHMLPCRPPTSICLPPHNVPPESFVGLGRSDLHDAIPTVDQINKLLCDLLVASEFAAFKQRWATGLEVPVDEESGKPVQPFEAAIDRVWMTPGDKAKFGEFSATELDNYDGAITARIASLAARTSTPPTYFPGPVIANVSDKGLKTTEAGLASKCDGKKTHGGESIEETMRISFAWMNDSRANATDMEINWAPSETRSQAEQADALTKLLTLGVPKKQLWSDYGYSPQQIEKFERMLLEQARNAGLFDINGPDVPPELDSPPDPDAE